MKLNPWNPLCRAFHHADAFINKAPKEFDPLAFCTPGFEFIDPMENVGHSVTDWEKLSPTDHEYRRNKACYLLGLAVGLRYAQVQDEILDKIIENYGETK